MEKFHHKDELENEAVRRDEIKKLRDELAEALEHIEDEFSLQKIDELAMKLENLESFKSDFDVKKEKDEFFQDYLPLVVEKKSQKQGINRGRLRQRVRAAIVLAAAFLCLNGATMAIAGTNIFEALFDWDNETFHIGTNSGNTKPISEKVKNELMNDNGTTWKELEEQYGAEIPIIGCFVETMDITSMEQLRDDLVDISFYNDDKEYIYSVQKLEFENTNMLLEKIEETPVEFNADGKTYYFVQNRNWLSIIWQFENQVYTISGNFDEVHAKMIAQSIIYEEDLN